MPFNKLSQVEADVYRLIYQSGTMSRAAIAEAIDVVSDSSLYRILNKLVEKDLLVEGFSPTISNGRPPKAYSINPKFAYAIGVSISWDSVGVALVDISGNIISSTYLGVTKELTPSEAFERIISAIREYVEKFDCRNSIVGIGVAAFGPIMKDQGILSYGHHRPSPAWEYVPIKDVLESETGYPVIVDSLVNAQLTNQLALNPEILNKRVALLLFDLGIGSAFSFPRMPLTTMDISSHLGHMIIDYEGQQCVCGKRGCLETIASANAIFKRMNASSCSQESSDLLFDALKIIDEQFDDGNHEHQKTIAALLAGMSNYLQIQDPDIVFLAGRTLEAMPNTFKHVIDKLRELSTRRPAYSQIEFIQIDVGEESLFRGAASNFIFERIGKRRS